MNKCITIGCSTTVPRRKDGTKQSRCNPCIDNLRNYGITKPERDKILLEQDHKCAICDSPIEFDGAIQGSFSRHLACVDHNHALDFKNYRSILCRPCNVGLGKFEDNAEWLEAAAAYIRRHNEEPNSTDLLPS